MCVVFACMDFTNPCVWLLVEIGVVQENFCELIVFPVYGLENVKTKCCFKFPWWFCLCFHWWFMLVSVLA